jgi:hypothetical protein
VLCWYTCVNVESLTQQSVAVEQVGQVVYSLSWLHHSLRVLGHVVSVAISLYDVEVVRVRESIVDCKERNPMSSFVKWRMLTIASGAIADRTRYLSTLSDRTRAH